MTDTMIADAQALAGRIVHDATQGQPLAQLTLRQLGELNRAVKIVAAEVKTALDAQIVTAAERGGMTYVDLAYVSGYGSFATISKVLRAASVELPKGPR